MNKQPDFTNDAGIKWWKEDILTRHAFESIGSGYAVYRIEKPGDLRQSYVLTDGIGVIEEEYTMEAMAVKLDIKKYMLDNQKD